MNKKLAIISTHPIQYNAPFFQMLAQRKNLDFKVFYTWGEKVLEEKYDPGFSRIVSWDVDLLGGYDSVFVKNTSSKPGSHAFKGIDNPGLIADLKSYAPDTLLIYGWKFKSHLKLIRYFKGKIPVFFRGDSTMIQQASGWRSVVRKVVLSWVYRHIDLAFYTGIANKEYFFACGLTKSKLKYMPHSVDNDRFAKINLQEKEDLIQWKKSLGLKTDDVVFLYAGKLEPKKSADFLLETFCSLSLKNVKLIVAGNGQLEEGLKNKYSNSADVIFLPFQNQSRMPLLYRLGSVFVLPSAGPSETWGLSINEAMASGRVVLVSNACGGAKDLVKDSYNGYIFESGNSASLKKSLIKLTTQTSQLSQMGQNSQRIIQHFNYEVCCKVLEKEIANC